MTKEGYICCLCFKHILGWGNKRQFGNNPQPLESGGKECCDDCNKKVIYARIRLLK